MADFLNGMPLPETRQGIEDMIEALIARLDAADDDPDLEDDGSAEPEVDDEPSLGASEGLSGTNWKHLPVGRFEDEREIDTDDEYPDGGPLRTITHWPCNPITFRRNP